MEGVAVSGETLTPIRSLCFFSASSFAAYASAHSRERSDDITLLFYHIETVVSINFF